MAFQLKLLLQKKKKKTESEKSTRIQIEIGPCPCVRLSECQNEIVYCSTVLATLRNNV